MDTYEPIADDGQASPMFLGLAVLSQVRSVHRSLLTWVAHHRHHCRLRLWEPRSWFWLPSGEDRIWAGSVGRTRRPCSTIIHSSWWLDSFFSMATVSPPPVLWRTLCCVGGFGFERSNVFTFISSCCRYGQLCVNFDEVYDICCCGFWAGYYNL